MICSFDFTINVNGSKMRQIIRAFLHQSDHEAFSAWLLWTLPCMLTLYRVTMGLALHTYLYTVTMDLCTRVTMDLFLHAYPVQSDHGPCPAY